MKKFLLAALSALTVFTASAQSGAVLEKPVVDRRVELLSIVFRLAGRPEYSDTDIKIYTDRIERHFGAYRDHEVIRLARTLAQRDFLRRTYAVGDPPWRAAGIAD